MALFNKRVKLIIFI